MFKLNLFCQNIHQQGRWASRIPLWIIDCFKENTVVILNEFNRKVDNIHDFYRGLNENGFEYFVTNYNPFVSANDTLIAIKKTCGIKIKSVSYVSAYYEPQKTNNLDIDYEIIPENLRVDISINDKIISVIGIRIKSLGGDFKKRLQQFEFLLNQIKQIPNDVIVAGDFNNAWHPNNVNYKTKELYDLKIKRYGLKDNNDEIVPFDKVERFYWRNDEETKQLIRRIQYDYNLHRIQEKLKNNGLNMIDEGSSTHKAFSEDHIFISENIENAICKSSWDFMTRKNGYVYDNHREWELDRYREIPKGLPDHAILIADITFSDIDN